MIELSANMKNNVTRTITIVDKPDHCPLCNKGIDPILSYSFLDENFPKRVQIIFRCPREDCRRLFIGIYFQPDRFGASHRRDYELRLLTPTNIEEIKFSKEIEETSKPFCEIYTQANFAEKKGLKDICGAGYRKALEFLIKDYAINKYADRKEDIKKLFLGKIINEYVEDSKIKNCAKRAVWLGNDEIHYTRRWEDKELKDLKILIDLTTNWIESEILTEKYIEDMNNTP